MAGYIKDHRKELDSLIWSMPPLYHRVWQYLKYKANHHEADLKLKDGSTLKILPGQHLTSIRAIAKGVAWYERGKLTEPNPKTIDSVLKWLKEQGMIEILAVTSNTPTTVSGNTLGTLITLINWAFYQIESVPGNSNFGGVTCYQGTEQKEYINNTITTTAAASHVPESSIPPSAVSESSDEPYIQILNAYCELHKRLDIHVKSKERQAMGRLVAGGVPSPFTKRTMSLLYEEKRKREEESFKPPTTFLYYENAIWEAWRNEQPKEQDVPPPAPSARDQRPVLTSAGLGGRQIADVSQTRSDIEEMERLRRLKRERLEQIRAAGGAP